MSPDCPPLPQETWLLRYGSWEQALAGEYSGKETEAAGSLLHILDQTKQCPSGPLPRLTPAQLNAMHVQQAEQQLQQLRHHQAVEQQHQQRQHDQHLLQAAEQQRLQQQLASSVRMREGVQSSPCVRLGSAVGMLVGEEERRCASLDSPVVMVRAWAACRVCVWGLAGTCAVNGVWRQLRAGLRVREGRGHAPASVRGQASTGCAFLLQAVSGCCCASRRTAVAFFRTAR